jgi:hypothetical protein
MFNNVFRKMRCLWDNMDKYCTGRTGHRWQCNMAHAHYMLDTEVYKHTLIICNTTAFHGNNGCMKTPQCYVIRTSPVWFIMFCISTRVRTGMFSGLKEWHLLSIDNPFYCGLGGRRGRKFWRHSGRVDLTCDEMWQEEGEGQCWAEIVWRHLWIIP